MREIAAALGTSWEGDGEKHLTGVADIEAAGADDISFAASRRALEAAHRSSAGCIIVPGSYPNPAGRTLIRAADPRGAFARVVSLLLPAEVPEPGIHLSAFVHPEAQLGPGVSVGPHVSIERGARIGPQTTIGAGCRIGRGAELGAGCKLYPNVTVYPDVAIGDRATLHAGCVLGADGFGFVLSGGRYEKFPQTGRVLIGNDVEIGANSCVDRAALGVTSIGDGTKLDNMVHIGHNCHIGKHVVIAAQTGLSGGVVVGDYAVIGGQVGIGDKARIESKAILGSGSGVLTSKIVRSGQVMWGVPARPLREYLEQLAYFNRLPEIRTQMDEIKARLAKLEASRPQSNGDTEA